MKTWFGHIQGWIGTWLLAALLVACASSGSGTSTTTRILPTANPAIPRVSGGVPSQLTSVELAAGQIGEVSYSGYACAIAPLGCACENPVVQKVKFTFTPDNRLLYDAAIVGGKPSEWQLDHAGVNQWSYASPLLDKDGKTQAVLFALISFTPDGYVLTQVTTMSTGETVKCPDVNFRRLSP